MWTIAAEQLIKTHAEATVERTALRFMSSSAHYTFKRGDVQSTGDEVGN